ncbi:Uma2 family endonuclease [Leptolyngbya sp. FACHB-17]|uniref:Uma2 family endonuclease n=1 Tax=unclassified Leptolyngbya TaxID=2650499 RepID=UPI0016810D2C|nr:Uma2 family endonuclease [Leptolyngbya sp. FACHB-17]MBD2078764.1 Uma2 family endonuclease [Leptolyngbya sp. FACHB-17]
MSTIAQRIIRRSSDEVPVWQIATWNDYLACCKTAEIEQPEHFKIYFNQGYLYIDMGWEGIDHARVRELITMLIAFWFSQHPEQSFDCLGGCVLEKPNQRAASPDQVLYLGSNSPRWQEGEPRRINLRQWHVPNLVCEVADTTLATDLDEKKQIYAALEILEYWVIDVSGARVVAFALQADGRYQQCESSIALQGLSIRLIEQTLSRLAYETNGTAALWFVQQISNR